MASHGWDGQGSRLRLLLGRLGGMFGLVPVSPEITRQLAYRVIEASGVKPSWERRLLELADGKSVGEIIEILYWEELKRGAWALDIGIWKNLFDQSVVRTIRELADRGYIRLQPGNGSKVRGE